MVASNTAGTMLGSTGKLASVRCCTALATLSAPAYHRYMSEHPRVLRRSCVTSCAGSAHTCPALRTQTRQKDQKFRRISVDLQTMCLLCSGASQVLRTMCPCSPLSGSALAHCSEYLQSMRVPRAHGLSPKMLNDVISSLACEPCHFCMQCGVWKCGVALRSVDPSGRAV